MQRCGKSYLSSFLFSFAAFKRKCSSVTFGQPILFTFSWLPFSQSQCIICILNFKSLPNLQSCTWDYYLQQAYLHQSAHTLSSDCILTDLAGLCMFSMMKNIWLGVVERNVETRTHLCCAWNGQTAISGVLLRSPVILRTVISKHLVFHHLVSVQVSLLFSYPAVWFALEACCLAEELRTGHPEQGSEA